MAFIRVKKIKGYKYAYRVENKWKKRVPKGIKKGSRQKVKGYLGRVYTLELVRDVDFYEFVGVGNGLSYLKSKNCSEIVKDLVRYELFKHGFEEAGKLISNGKIFFDMDENRFFIDPGSHKGIVLELNEGFMCKDTINRLIKFRASGEGERELGVKLATLFLEAGLMVPQEVFVGFFRKIVG